MIAELQLYWLVYERYSASPPDFPKANRDLNAWRKQHVILFGQALFSRNSVMGYKLILTPDQPRSQFLQLGQHFAHLLAQCEATKANGPTANVHSFEGVMQSSKAIIDIFIDTADDRTRHLSDHIYHVVTFAALVLCRLLQNHGAVLEEAGHDRHNLCQLIERIIDQLRSVGLPCHAAYMLASVVAAKFKALPNDFHNTSANPEDNGLELTDQALQDYWPLEDFTFMYPDFGNISAFD